MQPGTDVAQVAEQIYQNIRDFRVVVDETGEIIGCGAMHVLWGDLGEVRFWLSGKVTKARTWTHAGHPSRRRCQGVRLPTVFALTYVPDFFESLGFKRIDKNQLPHKIWGDCIDCPKFPNCDEVAVLRDLKAEG